ncbi:MAG TPA: cupredoxin domain-containing protein [Chloroflexia bacterium]
MTDISYRLQTIRRRALIGTLGAALLVSLAACGTAGDPAGSAPPPATVAPTATVAVAAEAAATATPSMDAGMDMSTMPPDAPTSAEATPTVAAPASDASAGNAVQVQATLREWALDLNQTEVPAGTVRFVVNNQGRFAHNFTIKDANNTVLGKTPTFAADKGPQVVEVTLAPGTYTVYCSLPGHAAQGQQNTIVVK